MLKYWNIIINTGIHPGLDVQEARTVRLLNRVAMLLILTMFVFMPMEILLGETSMLHVGIGGNALMACNFYLCYKRRYFLAKLLFMVISWTLLTSFTVYVGIDGGSQYFLILGCIIPVILFQENFKMYFFSGLNLLILILSFFYMANFEPLIAVNEDVVEPFHYAVVLTVAVISFLMVIYLKKDNLTFEDRLSQKNHEISEKNKEITDSITYAQRLQNAIIPSADEFNRICKDAFVLFRPKDIVSGDFYWLHEKGNKLWAAAVDCTGHGVPGAMVSVVGHNGLNRCIKELKLEETGEILNALSAMVEETFKTSEYQVKDGMDLSLVCIDRDKMELYFSGANNPMYLLSSVTSEVSTLPTNHRKIENENGRLVEIKGDKQPIGAYEDKKPFTTHSIKLNEGDVVYLFSDGFADQFGGPSGKKFKYKPFKNLLLEHHSDPMEKQCSILDESLENWRGDIEQVDDVCIIGIRL